MKPPSDSDTEAAAQSGGMESGGIVSGKTTSPQDRVASAEEVADVILFLASWQASEQYHRSIPADRRWIYCILEIQSNYQTQ